MDYNQPASPPDDQSAEQRPDVARPIVPPQPGPAPADSGRPNRINLPYSPDRPPPAEPLPPAGAYGQPPQNPYLPQGQYQPPGQYLPPNQYPPPGQYPPQFQPAAPSPWPQQQAIEGAVVHEGVLYAPAGFALRLYAFVLDGLVLGLLNQLLTMLSHVKMPDQEQVMKVLSEMVSAFLSTGTVSGELLARMQTLEAGLRLVGWLNIGLCAAYFTIAHGMFGTTPGKMVFGLRVLRRTGQDLGIGLAFLRYLGYLLCARFLYTAWLIPFTAEKRTAYDMVLKTNVFKPLGSVVPPSPPSDSYYGQH